MYRRYASLYFIVGIDDEDSNELGILEFIHAFVEVRCFLRYDGSLIAHQMLDKYFGNVCELDLMFSIDVSHHILDEMVVNGHIVETNRCVDILQSGN